MWKRYGPELVRIRGGESVETRWCKALNALPVSLGLYSVGHKKHF